MAREVILILDFGSQYTHLIKTVLRSLGIDSVIEPADLALKQRRDYKVKGIILSGGAFSVDEGKVPFDEEWLLFGVPVLGICYGHQLIARVFGGEVEEFQGEYGREVIKCDTSVSIFSGIEPESVAWMSHSDSVTELPENFVSVVSTEDNENAAIWCEDREIYGLQFHPEVSHTSEGVRMLDNFATKICGLRRGPTWSPERFMQKMRVRYRRVIGQRKVILGLSGGVDSSTLAVVLRSFLPKEQILAVYIDSGLEPSSVREEVKEFCKEFDVRLKIKESSEAFFEALKGVIGANEKRVVVGEVFIRGFEKVAKEVGADVFAQGTIWSDVIESGVTRYSSAIKPHHNVGGLPERLDFELIEPLRELFKEQVRELALFLGLPGFLVDKEVFPGPGYAIRIGGEVTKEKVEVVRRSTELIEEVILEHDLERRDMMAFAVYIEVESSGVRGDKRFVNDYAIVIRVVETANLLTANFSESIYPYLGEMANKIIKETGAGKVLYDVTNKPPSTIDWY